MQIANHILPNLVVASPEQDIEDLLAGVDGLCVEVDQDPEQQPEGGVRDPEGPEDPEDVREHRQLLTDRVCREETVLQGREGIVPPPIAGPHCARTQVRPPNQKDGAAVVHIHRKPGVSIFINDVLQAGRVLPVVVASDAPDSDAAPIRPAV